MSFRSMRSTRSSTAASRCSTVAVSSTRAPLLRLLERCPHNRTQGVRRLHDWDSSDGYHGDLSEFRPDQQAAFDAAVALFWLKVDRLPGDGCWLWTAGKDRDGYGRFGARGAHVWAWRIAHGFWPPDGLCVCHHCDTPSCVRPDHLFLGSHQENIDDMVRKRRQRGGRRRSGSIRSRSPGRWEVRVTVDGRQVSRTVRGAREDAERAVLAAARPLIHPMSELSG